MSPQPAGHHRVQRAEDLGERLRLRGRWWSRIVPVFRRPLELLSQKGSTAHHEDFSRNSLPASMSNRAFGLALTVLFSVVGLWPLVHRPTPRWWALGVAAAASGLAVFRSDSLGPLNRFWRHLGLAVHRLVSFLVLTLVFYLFVTPTGLVMRVLGRDVLGRQLDRARDTYWIRRQPEREAGASLRRQF
jgi:hypothetical protein